jgi:hypothetical protein
MASSGNETGEVIMEHIRTLEIAKGGNDIRADESGQAKSLSVNRLATTARTALQAESLVRYNGCWAGLPHSIPSWAIPSRCHPPKLRGTPHLKRGIYERYKK